MKSKHLKSISILVALAMILATFMVFSGCSNNASEETASVEDAASGEVSTSSEDDASTYVFTFASPMPDGHPMVENFMDPWVEKVEEATDGRVQFTMYYGETLLAADSALQGISSGLADAGLVVNNYFPGELPLFNALAVPGFEWTNGKVAINVNNSYVDAFPEVVNSELEFMFIFSPAPGCIFTNEPIESIEDLEGLQIRCDSSASDAIAALGATPVAMTMAEAYEALSKNTIDGVLGNTEPLVGWNLYEVVDYMVEIPCLYNASPNVCMNKDAWDSLPEDLQNIILEVNAQHFEDIQESFDNIYLESLQFGLDNGLQVTTLSDGEYESIKEALASSQQTYEDFLNEEGLPGTAALEKIGELVDQYNTEFEEYSSNLRDEIDALIAQYQ